MSGLEHWLTGLPPEPLYLFIFAWLFVESVGFPISDEPILLPAMPSTLVERLSKVGEDVIRVLNASA
jgi:hypothetical protein